MLLPRPEIRITSVFSAMVRLARVLPSSSDDDHLRIVFAALDDAADTPHRLARCLEDLRGGLCICRSHDQHHSDAAVENTVELAVGKVAAFLQPPEQGR